MIVYKFKTKAMFDRAVKAMNKAIKDMGTSRFDYSYQPDTMTIVVDEDNALIVEGWFKKNRIDYKLDREPRPRFRRMAKRIASKVIVVKPVTRKYRVSEETYDLCPHCAKEIGEKETFYDEKGIQGEPGLWYHRGCNSPIEFPTPDYTQYNGAFLSFLTPEQLKIREEQIRQPKGQTFYFRIKTYGDNPENFILCGPDCEYLSIKDYNCGLFKKDLKRQGPSTLRCKECISAVEGLI